ncbi:hypothetical protein GPECTOR_39g499 [Gonium pectorale]|uniref:Serine aminopeptidase S33 domain-containing protein n=1 Tax=Gonium pectorale TaxID=33097 RepID=A0A150GBT1_GONPE|nr:hypothetical protein GPECTOR_39g499 [Gonium pectorale]|eukprot:KXZ47005.1 hypothetical protein GPECTOR_39g499 [Gonium pectorale]
MASAAAEQPCSFVNPHGERLAAKLVDAGPDSAVAILCHGYAACKDGFVFPAMAAALAERGLSSLRFDFAGNGESEGSFSFGGYYREVEDLRAAVGFVRSELRRSVAAIVGHSKGGNVVLLYAAKYDDVPRVVSVAGRAVMGRGIQERFGSDILERLAAEGWVEQRVRVDAGRTITYRLTKQAVDERLAMDMLGELARVAASRVLTLHGAADTTIPPEDGAAIAQALNRAAAAAGAGAESVGEAAGRAAGGGDGEEEAEGAEEGGRAARHRLVVVAGADHNFRRPPGAAAELIGHVVESYWQRRTSGDAGA